MPIRNLDPQWLADLEDAIEYVSLIDANDALLYVNRVGAASDELAGQSVYQFVDPQFHDLLRDAVSAARASGVPQHYNSYAPNMQGERALYSNWVVALNHKSLKGVVAFIATDVTELSRMEAELELSESTLRSIVENSPDTIFVINRNRELTFASKLEYGFESSQVLGVRADLFIPEEDRPTALAAFERVLEKGVVASYDAAIETPEGPRHFTARLAPIRNGDEIDRVMVVVTDVTEAREAEEAQARLRLQLQHSQKMEAIGQLTGGVAHDFNNLLLTISGNLELAQSCLDDGSEGGAFINDALHAVQRAKDLTQRLLAFSRKQPLSPEAVAVGTLVKSMDSFLRRTLGETIAITTQTANTQDYVCRVDRAQLENAILNLALNARDAMPEGGEMVISAAWVSELEASEIDAPLGCVRLSVADSGSGMDADTLSRAIEPFFTTKPAGEGSGLGLSMVYGFAQQSGGALRLRSEPGNGTTAEIDLPCVEGPAFAVDDVDTEAAAPRGHGELILLVEDDASVRALTDKLLKTLGYSTLLAHDGNSALQLVRARDDIAMVITDVVMPGAMDGFELAERCRELRSDLPIMLVSGHPLDTRASQRHQRWSGVLLQKPYRTEELAAFISRVLSGSQAS